MLTSQQVRYIANLSRIHLEESEVQYLTSNLADILQYIEKLEKLDVRNVEPTSHALPLTNVFRDDKIKLSLSQSEALQISQNKHKGFFQVPKVIE